MKLAVIKQELIEVILYPRPKHYPMDTEIITVKLNILMVPNKNQDILLNDLTVVTRPQLWYKKFRYKIMSTRFGPREQEIFEEMQEFCLDSFEHGDYKLNDTFRITSKSYQKKMNALWESRANKRLRQTGGMTYPVGKYTIPSRSPWQRAVYIITDDVVTLHMVYKKYYQDTRLLLQTSCNKYNKGVQLWQN